MRVRHRSARILAAFAALPLAISCPVTTAAQVAATTGVGSQFELTFWQSVESGDDAALYEAYLAQYPNGTFAALARVKLMKLRQSAPAAVSPSPPAVAPTPAPPSVPAPVIAATVAPKPALAPPVPVAATVAATAPATKQLAAARTEPLPAPLPASREQIAPRAVSESAPYVTAAPPVEPAGENADSAALRRLLGALGESQRTGAPPPTPIVEDAEAGPSDSAQVAAPAPSAVSAAAPGAAAPRLVEVTAPVAKSPATPAAAPIVLGPPLAVPDAAALSASTTPVADPHPIAVGPLPSGFTLPPRPRLAQIPPLAFPASFCSAEARNAFHDSTYITAVEAAKRNNDAAIAYLRQLQDLYDANQLSGDINPVNAIAAEARAYGPVAAAAFSAQSVLVNAFSALMAVPVTACEAPRQP